MKSNKVCILAMSFALTYSPVSFSEVYFGATIGQSSSNDNTTASDFSWLIYTNIDNETSDMKDTAYSVFGGYDFKISNNDFSVEMGWVNLGEYSLSASGQDAPPAGDGRRSIDLTAEAEAITISIIAVKKVSREIGLRGKIGISSWDISGELNGEVKNLLGNVTGVTKMSASDSGQDMFFGLGLEYKNVLVQFERYSMDGSNASFISLGFKI